MGPWHGALAGPDNGQLRTASQGWADVILGCTCGYPRLAPAGATSKDGLT